MRNNAPVEHLAAERLSQWVFPTEIKGCRNATALLNGAYISDFVYRESLENFLKVCTLCMDVQVDRLGKIKAEDSHDGLCIDHIAAGDQIKIIGVTVDIIDKLFYFVDRVK